MQNGPISAFEANDVTGTNVKIQIDASLKVSERKSEQTATGWLAQGTSAVTICDKNFGEKFPDGISERTAAAAQDEIVSPSGLAVWRSSNPVADATGSSCFALRAAVLLRLGTSELQAERERR